MLKSQTIIVIPCYNEADRLPVEQFANYDSASSDTGFLLVNDGSSDDTQAVLEKLCADNPGCCMNLNLLSNQGKAEAVRQGIQKAFESDPKYVGFWDADLATPLNEISRLQQVLEKNDNAVMATGARVQLLGRNIQRSMTRHYLGRIFATCVSMMLRLPVYDTQCGAKLFRVGEAASEMFNEPFLSRWIFDVELIARLMRYRKEHNLEETEQAIIEVPLQEWCDVAGSKLKTRHMIGAMWDILRIHHHYPPTHTTTPQK